MSDQTNLAEATYNEIILLKVLEIFHKNKKKIPLPKNWPTE